MKFVLQTQNNNIVNEQCFYIERCKEYYDWKGDSFSITYCDLNEINKLVNSNSFNPNEWCPIGTIEFVEKYIRVFFGDIVANNIIKPMNIPEIFFNKARSKRNIFNIDLKINKDKYICDPNKYFIKDNVRIKNSANGIQTIAEAFNSGMTNIQVQEVISNIESEWRVFIHNGLAVDIKNYSGSPFIFPDLHYIDKCALLMFDQLKEGTIDFGIANIGGKKETFIIECHRFFSIGLYGFYDNAILPLMFWRTYRQFSKDFK